MRAKRPVLELAASRRRRLFEPRRERGLRAFVDKIRNQPAVGWKLASTAAFSAGYCLEHSLTSWLLLVGVTWAVGFPLGYVIFRIRG